MEPIFVLDIGPNVGHVQSEALDEGCYKKTSKILIHRFIKTRSLLVYLKNNKQSLILNSKELIYLSLK